MTAETTALATKTDNQVAMVNPISAVIADADILGAWMAKCGMFGCDNIEQGKMMAMICLVEKITPDEFTRTYHMIDGRLSMSASAMLAKFRKHGGDYDIIERTDERCEVKFTWLERDTIFDYTMAEAKQAGLVRPGSGWETRPKNMLFSRCCSNYLNTYVPELFAGHVPADDMRNNVPENGRKTHLVEGESFIKPPEIGNTPENVVGSPSDPSSSDASNDKGGGPDAQNTLDATPPSLSECIIAADLDIKKSCELLVSKGILDESVMKKRKPGMIKALNDIESTSKMKILRQWTAFVIKVESNDMVYKTANTDKPIMGESLGGRVTATET